TFFPVAPAAKPSARLGIPISPRIHEASVGLPPNPCTVLVARSVRFFSNVGTKTLRSSVVLAVRLTITCLFLTVTGGFGFQKLALLRQHVRLAEELPHQNRVGVAFDTFYGVECRVDIFAHHEQPVICGNGGGCLLADSGFLRRNGGKDVFGEVAAVGG